jgi:hypothetical protein
MAAADGAGDVGHPEARLDGRPRVGRSLSEKSRHATMAVLQTARFRGAR